MHARASADTRRAAGGCSMEQPYFFDCLAGETDSLDYTRGSLPFLGLRLGDVYELEAGGGAALDCEEIVVDG